MRAKEILKQIESGNVEKPEKIVKNETAQFDIFDNTRNEIFEELKDMDVTTYTPIEALNKLYELAKKAKE